MKPHRISLAAAATLGLALLTGCATQRAPYDYTAFLKARPATLLVMPPLNDSPKVTATPSVWAQATAPLAEAGYYVLPVTLVDETFRQNGVTSAHDAHEIALPKLREVFGADAAVFMKVRQYGTSYRVIGSDTRVTLDARIVDLRSGEQLWQGSATASSAEQQQQSGGGIVGLLVMAVVKQTIESSTDASFNYAGIANQRLLAPRVDGILPSPRSPKAGQIPAPQR
ncbi:DUF799 domain-containing protein [Pseudorhodoferax sp. Leaf267]|uniref:DUF799 domain-containing protein n=1 Tax=Pseudorhodoferax sp. Leaf267 TaxID=1736316 RepID=UPI0006F961F5|nr:DUF799 domain-containing protein [Pseudorhodoferax sp. Leaf267]KQP14042.1 hypothetical protein ASF43_14420 [Pseudorhodoferax sp. Leaf267]